MACQDCRSGSGRDIANSQRRTHLELTAYKYPGDDAHMPVGPIRRPGQLFCT